MPGGPVAAVFAAVIADFDEYPLRPARCGPSEAVLPAHPAAAPPLGVFFGRYAGRRFGAGAVLTKFAAGVGASRRVRDGAVFTRAFCHDRLLS